MAAQRISLSLALTTLLLLLAGALLLLGANGIGLPVAHALGPDNPGTLYVAPDGDCGGMTPCFDEIQAAVDAAVEGDAIKVATGVYSQVNNYGGLAQVVYITRSLTLRGGYTVTDWDDYDPDAHPTTVNAQRLGRGLYINSSGSVTVEGLVVTGGDGKGMWPGGGGMYAHAATLVISDNLITDNIASTGDNGEGGGMYVMNGTTVMIVGNTVYTNTACAGADNGRGGGIVVNCACKASLIDNTIVDNLASNYPFNSNVGGGVYLLSPSSAIFNVVGNRILNNRAGSSYSSDAGGLYGHPYQGRITVIDNVIEGNSAGGDAGGLWISTNYSFTLEGNTIRANVAADDCGGLEVIGYNPSKIRGNLVQENRAEGNANGGGGLCLDAFIGETHLWIENNAFIDNWAFEAGSAIHSGSSYVRAHLRHNTIARNGGPAGVSGIHVYGGVFDAVDTIVAGHDVGVENEYGTATMDHTLWDGNGTDIVGAVTTSNDVYGASAFALDGHHLTYLSAAIDAGVNVSLATDLDGQPRPMRDDFDIGADEFPYYAIVEPGPGGDLVYTDTQGLPTIIRVPPGGVTDTILLAYVPLAAPTHPLPPLKAFANHAFTLDAWTLDGVHLPGFVFQAPVTVEVHYSNADVSRVTEPSLELGTWTGDAWQDAACGLYDRQAAANWLSLPVCHLSEFALIGEPYRVYLPLVMRSY